MDIYVGICMEDLHQCRYSRCRNDSQTSSLKIKNNKERIQTRMMCATFKSNSSTTIVSCYSPTNVRNEMDIITFYNELYSPVQHIPIYNVLIIVGDMNAQIGKDKTNKFCLHNSPNRNGVCLTKLFFHENGFKHQISEKEGKSMYLYQPK